MRHEFVEHIPEGLEDGVLYVSIPYDLAVHRCCCGCGNEVVTPFSPAEWSLIYDGRSVSLSPSIGNWGFPCKSHYFIRQGDIVWARKWSTEEISAVREIDHDARAEQYGDVIRDTISPSRKPARVALWDWIKGLFS
jgi:hypothetical protein